MTGIRMISGAAALLAVSMLHQPARAQESNVITLPPPVETEKATPYDDRLARLERTLTNDMAIIKAAVVGTTVTTSGPNRGTSLVSISTDAGDGDPFEEELQIASALSPAKEQAFLVLTGFAAR